MSFFIFIVILIVIIAIANRFLVKNEKSKITDLPMPDSTPTFQFPTIEELAPESTPEPSIVAAITNNSSTSKKKSTTKKPNKK